MYLTRVFSSFFIKWLLKFLNGLKDITGRWITKGVKERVIELLIDKKAQYFWSVFFPNDPGYPYGTTFAGHVTGIQQDQNTLKKALQDWTPCPDPLGIRSEAWEWANLVATSLTPHTKVEDLPNGIIVQPAPVVPQTGYLIQMPDGGLKIVSFAQWKAWTNANLSNNDAGYACPGCHGNIPTWVGPLDEKPSEPSTPAWAYLVPFGILGFGAAFAFEGIAFGLMYVAASSQAVISTTQ